MRTLFKTTLCQLLVILLSFSSSLLSSPLLSRSAEPLAMQWITTSPFTDSISAFTSDLNTLNEQQMVTDRLYLTTYPANEKPEIHYADSPVDTFQLWNAVSQDNLKNKKPVALEAFHFGEGARFSSFLFIGTETNGAYGIRLSPKPRNLPLYSSSLDNEQRSIRSMQYEKELRRLLITVDGKGLYEMDFQEFVKATSLLGPNDPPPNDPPPKNPSNPIYEPTIMKWGRIGQYMENWSLDNAHSVKPDFCYGLYTFSLNHIWALTDQGIFETSDMEDRREVKVWTILRKQPGIETTKGSQKVFTQAIPYAIQKHGASLWVVTNLGVFATSDEGRTWTHIQAISPESFSSLSQDNPPFIATHPNFPKEIWIASPTIVFHSKDNGAKWDPLPFDAPLAEGTAIQGLEILKTSDTRGNPIALPVIGLSDGRILRYMVDTNPPRIESLQIDDQFIVQNNQTLPDLEEPITLQMKEGVSPILKGQIKAESGSPVQDIQIQIGENEYQSIMSQYDPPTRLFSTSLQIDQNKETKITLTITDQNGNTPNPISFRVILSQPDDTPPEIESLRMEEKVIIKDKTLQINPDVFFWIKTKTPTLHMTVKDEGSGVKKIIYSVGRETKEIMPETDNSGVFSFPLPPLEEGKVVRIGLFAEDYQGNKSKEVYCHMQVDASPPAIIIQPPEPGKITSPIDLSFSVVEDGSGIADMKARHQNNDITSKIKKISATQYYLEAITLREGINTLTIQAIDMAGNAAEKSIDIPYGDANPPPPQDATPPQINITNPATSRSTTNNSQIVIQGTITDESPPIKATINGKTLTLKQDSSFSHTLILREGENTITIEATDRFDNQITMDMIVTYIKDSLPPPRDSKPVIQIQSHHDQQRVEGKDITLSGTITDPDNDLASVKLTLNQTNSITLSWGKDGSFQQPLTLLPGKNTLTLTAIDQQQHSTSQSLTIIYWPEESILIELWIGKTQATINTKQTTLDAPPELKSSRTFVPVRFIAEAFGASVTYAPKTKEIVITLGKKILTLWIGVNYIFVDDEGTYRKVLLDNPPYLRNNRTMLPLRAISEVFGAEIAWDQFQKKITLLYHPKGS